MLYWSETWCLRENEMVILRRTEKAMVREMCGPRLMEKKRTEVLTFGDVGIKGNLHNLEKTETNIWKILRADQ